MMAAPAVPVRLGHACTTAGEAATDMGRLLAGLTVYAAAFTWAVVAVWLCFGPVAALWTALVGGLPSIVATLGSLIVSVVIARRLLRLGDRLMHGADVADNDEPATFPQCARQRSLRLGCPQPAGHPRASARRTTAARSSLTAWPRWSGRSRRSGPGRSCQATMSQHQQAPTLPPWAPAGSLLARTADDGLARAARARGPSATSGRVG